MSYRRINGSAAEGLPVRMRYFGDSYDIVKQSLIRGLSDFGPWYNTGREVVMIELTEQQVEALEKAEATPPRVVNPRTKETFVLLRVEDYERLKEEEYDDSPWTSEERHALAWEAGKHAGWEEMDEYDDIPERP